MDRTAEQHIGARIRYWRRRRSGMSQETLAGLAGLSRSYITNIEAGRKPVDRRSTLVAIARALQVSVADLLGQPGDPTDPLKADAAAAVPAIEVALVEIEEGEHAAGQRRGDELAAAVDHAAELRGRSDYATMARLLPALLRDTAAADPLALARIAYEASVCLRNLGYRGLARPAARVALNAALNAADPAWIGAARFVYTLAMPIEAAGTTSRVADRALRDLQAAAGDPRARQMLGQLHLSASLACAVDKRPDDAAAHLRAAEDEADTLGEPQDGVGFNLSAFGPTNIGLWKMSVFTELGEHGKVIELAGTVNPSPLKVANRHQAYWMSYGRALTGAGKYDAQARAAFLRAEQAAPLPFSVNPLARDAVLAMVTRARRDAVPPDLRALATRLGIDVNSDRHS